MTHYQREEWEWHTTHLHPFPDPLAPTLPSPDSLPPNNQLTQTELWAFTWSTKSFTKLPRFSPRFCKLFRRHTQRLWWASLYIYWISSKRVFWKGPRCNNLCGIFKRSMASISKGDFCSTLESWRRLLTLRIILERIWVIGQILTWASGNPKLSWTFLKYIHTRTHAHFQKTKHLCLNIVFLSGTGWLHFCLSHCLPDPPDLPNLPCLRIFIGGKDPLCISEGPDPIMAYGQRCHRVVFNALA